MTIKQIIDDVFTEEFGYANENGDRYYDGCVITAFTVRCEVENILKWKIKRYCSKLKEEGAKIATKFRRLSYSDDIHILYDNDIDLDMYLTGTCMWWSNFLKEAAFSAVYEAVNIIHANVEYYKEQREITERLKRERRERKEKLRKESAEWDYLRFSRTGTDNYISVSGVNDAINEYLSTKDW